MTLPSEPARSYSLRELQRRHIDHFITVMEQRRDDWRAIERFVSQGQLLPVWDRALLHEDRAIRFMLAVRQYCTTRNLEREYFDRGRRISHQARQAVSAEEDLQFLLSLGEVARDLGESDLADAYLQQVLEHPFQEDADYRAIALHNMGYAYANREDWNGAINLYERALAVWREQGDDPEALTAIILSLGHALARIGEAQKGIRYLEEALATVTPLNRPVLEATIWDRVAWAYYDMGNVTKAIDAYGRALPLRRSAGDRDGEATTLTGLALAYRHLGEYRRALPLLQEALRIREALPDQDLTGVLNNLALTWLDLGDVRTAVRYLKRVLELEQQQGSVTGQATALNNIGLALADMDDFGRARDHYRRALRLWQTARNRRGIATALSNLAVAEIELHDLPAAMKHLLRAQRIQRSIDDVSGLAISLNNIGLTLHDTSQPARALPYYAEAAAIHEATNQRSEQITTLINQAKLQKRLQNLDAARTLLQRVIGLERQVGSPRLQEHLELLERWSRR